METVTATATGILEIVEAAMQVEMETETPAAIMQGMLGATVTEMPAIMEMDKRTEITVKEMET